MIIKATKNIVFTLAAVLWALILLSAIPSLRVIMARPLTASTAHPRGDAAYVLAGGYSMFERLSAAADLWQQRCIKQIVLLEDSAKAAYDFAQQRNLTKTEWDINFLECRGVAPEDIRVIAGFAEGALGTLSEAQALAAKFPSGVYTLVVITSAPHTQRSYLAFRRNLPNAIAIVPYAACSFDQSAEFHYPLWLEYLKLALYWIVA